MTLVIKGSAFELYDDPGHTWSHLQDHINQHTDDGWELAGYSSIWRADTGAIVHNFMWRRESREARTPAGIPID